MKHFLLDPRAKEAVFVIMLNEWYSPSPQDQEPPNHLSWSLPGRERGNVSGSSSLDLPRGPMDQLPVVGDLRHTDPETPGRGTPCLLPEHTGKMLSLCVMISHGPHQKSTQKNVLNLKGLPQMVEHGVLQFKQPASLRP